MTNTDNMQPGLLEQELELETDRLCLVQFNQLVQGMLMNMPEEEYNELLDVFRRRHVVLGGDSACFHILGKQRIKDCGTVIDCNPILEANPDSSELLPYVPITRTSIRPLKKG